MAGLVGAAAITGAASLIGGGISAIGAHEANQASARAARKMYQNRYQWQMEDLRKAGLNPMLTVAQGAPSGHAPQFQSETEGLARGVSGAAQAYQQYKMNEEQMRLMRAQGNAAIAAGDKADKEARLVEAQVPYSAQNAENQARSLAYQVEQAGVTIANLRKEGELKDIAVAQGNLTTEQMRKLQPLAIQYQEYVNRAMLLGMSEAQANSNFWNEVEELGKYGQWLPGVIKGVMAIVRGRGGGITIQR